jgi:apolipoprotein N-acyltransferase
MPLAFAPFDLAPIALLSLALLFYSWRETGPWQSFQIGYLFGLAQFGVGVSWVYISLHDYGGASPVAAAALTCALVAFLALYPALAGAISARLFQTNPILRMIVAYPALWTLTEWVRGWFISGFPWLNVGYSQLDTPIAGFAPVIGVYGVGWLTALSAGLILSLFYLPWRKAAGTGFVVVALWVSAAWLNQVEWSRPAGEPFTVTLLQGNIPQEIKWEPRHQRETLKLYIDMTRQHWDSDLVIWPETAVPAFYHQVEKSFMLPLKEEASKHGTDLLIGAPLLEQPGARYYNALISLGQTDGVYRKRHLVPFGEYLPLQPLSSFILDILQIPLADFSAGSDRQPLLEAAGFPLVASICYEDAFGEEALTGMPDGAYLVNVTNDAWFADSIGPLQHFQMARMRALELRRYMLRATNTGVTGIISPFADVVARAPQFERTTITGEIVPMSGSTPYSRYGNRPLVIGLFIVLLVSWAATKRLRLTRRGSSHGS